MGFWEKELLVNFFQNIFGPSCIANINFCDGIIFWVICKVACFSICFEYFGRCIWLLFVTRRHIRVNLILHVTFLFKVELYMIVYDNRLCHKVTKE